MKSKSTPATTPGKSAARPGAMLKSLRIQRGWTLSEVSKRTGFPVSTLSKMENDRVSLTYDKLTRISAGLEVDISRLFGAEDGEGEGSKAGGRRSVNRAGEGRSIASKNYSHVYPHADLLNKKLIPIVVENLSRNLDDFGELVRHSGEEFVFVLEGEIDVYTSLYSPVRLKAGDSIYLDSTMGHAYVAASDKRCRVIAVCSGTEGQMIAAVGGGSAGNATEVPPAGTRTRKRRRR